MLKHPNFLELFRKSLKPHYTLTVYMVHKAGGKCLQLLVLATAAGASTHTGLERLSSDLIYNRVNGEVNRLKLGILYAAPSHLQNVIMRLSVRLRLAMVEQ